MGRASAGCSEVCRHNPFISSEFVLSIVGLEREQIWVTLSRWRKVILTAYLCCLPKMNPTKLLKLFAIISVNVPYIFFLKRFNQLWDSSCSWQNYGVRQVVILKVWLLSINVQHSNRHSIQLIAMRNISDVSQGFSFVCLYGVLVKLYAKQLKILKKFSLWKLFILRHLWTTESVEKKKIFITFWRLKN